MSVGDSIGLVFIAFMIVAILSSATYFALAKLVNGKPRAILSAVIPSAYLLGRYQQAFYESGWDTVLSSEFIIVVVTHIIALGLFMVGSLNRERRLSKITNE